MPQAIETAYHLVNASNWPSVQNHGLMSARRLLEVYAAKEHGAARRHRPRSRRLAAGVLIRDQRPMPPKALIHCLQSGLAPEDWFELLNSKVFFWLEPERLNRQRLACGASPQIALVVNAERLLMNYRALAAVTPINTGNALRAAAPRNLTTFVPYERWLVDGWAYEDIPDARPRPKSHRPVELAISEAVPDIMDYIVAVVPLRAGETLSEERLATLTAHRWVPASCAQPSMGLRVPLRVAADRFLKSNNG